MRDIKKIREDIERHISQQGFTVIPTALFWEYKNSSHPTSHYVHVADAQVFGDRDCQMFNGNRLVSQQAYDYHYDGIKNCELQGQELPAEVQRPDVETLGREVRITLPSSVGSLRIEFR